ncbi:MAG: outer membrane lipoprotein carrier protein LolA [Myxococcales bacterium]|nr:outer membrane lipoprotein carrier protein LolA [Myxococcales bacterium]
MRKMLPLAALSLCAIASTRAAAAAAPPVADVVNKMQAFYNGTKDLKGKFKQVYTDTLYGSKRTSYGYLYVKKPGMMRWNYVSPERKAFIANGKTLWVWEPRSKQAFKNPLNTATLGTGLTFLLGSGNLLKEFRISYASDKKDVLGGPDHYTLKLLPIKPTGQYLYLLLAVRPSDHAVTESVIVQRNARNHFLFTNLETNTKLRPWRFQFKPPAGTRVINAAKMRK